MGDEFVLGGVRKTLGMYRSKRARAKKVQDEHRAALGKLIAPIRNAFTLADKFVEMCAEIELEDPVLDETLSRRLRDVVAVWGSDDVSPYVTDEAVREAWRRADVAGLADRWDRARAGPDLVNAEGPLTKTTARALACDTVAIDVRNALNGVRDAIRPYGLKPD